MIKISDFIVDELRDIRERNMISTKITMGQGVFDDLKHELESMTNIKVSYKSNKFMGIDIEIAGEKECFSISCHYK